MKLDGTTKTVMILSPHPDDAELGCGGTISKLIDIGMDVLVITFSPGYTSSELRKEEAKAAANVLGTRLVQFDYPDRGFERYRQEILDTILSFRDKFRPFLSFIPMPADIHQDHQTIFQEGYRALRYGTLFGYELLWNIRTVSQTCFVSLSEENLNKKLAALDCYGTQKDKHYFDPKYIKALACARGTQARVLLAEAFEVLRCYY